MIVNPMIYSGKKLPELDNPGTAADLLAGKQLVDQYGNPLTGTMPQKSAGDLSASGATVTVPAGYYPDQVSKKVAEAVQATPGISVSNNGLITASATQGEGYVAAGTKNATQQLTTQAGNTVMPGTSLQTAVASGRYTTGPVYVAGDANLVAGNIKSGVSIFGITGNLPSVEESYPFIIYNKSAVNVGVTYMYRDAGLVLLMGSTVSSNQNLTLYFPINTVFLISNIANINNITKSGVIVATNNAIVDTTRNIFYIACIVAKNAVLTVN